MRRRARVRKARVTPRKTTQAEVAKVERKGSDCGVMTANLLVPRLRPSKVFQRER